MKIKNLSAGYGLDCDGFIVSDVHEDKIDNLFKPCIHTSVESIRNKFRLDLHSVYVYGSVARGEAIAKKSDLDLIALFNSKLSDVKLNELKKLSGELSKQHRSLVRDVGIAVAYYDYTVDPMNYYENAFLKELCVCVYGEDLGARFGPYKLTSEIAIRFNGDIHEVLNRTLTKLETDSEEDFKIYTQNIARKLIRTFYSMVMVRSQIWTTRLQEQSEVFIHYFPEKESIVRMLLHWVEDPPTDRNTVYELFKNEGVLRPNGVFITQQVGGENGNRLSNMLIPNFQPRYRTLNLRNTQRDLEESDFVIKFANEYFPYQKFFNMEALIYYAKVIEWEFPAFNVRDNFEQLLNAYKELTLNGYVLNYEHRFIIVAYNNKQILSV